MKKLKRALTLAVTVMLIAVMLLAAACGNGNTENTDLPGPGPGPDPGTDPGPGPGELAYSVTVTRSGGVPISKITVFVLDSNNGFVSYGNTDDNGVMRFNAAAADYTVRLTFVPDGYTAADSYALSAAQPNLVITLSATVISDPAPSSTRYELGSVFHDFSYTDTRGNTNTLANLLSTKKMVLLNFWFVGCSWCYTEFPALDRAYKNYKSSVEVLAITPYDNTAQAENYRSDMDLSFPVVSRDNACATAITAAFGITNFPTSVVIDREGVVCLIHVDAADQAQFEQFFEEYTAEPYVQKIHYPGENTQDKPDVAPPAAADVAALLNDAASGFNGVYAHPQDEYNWPWVISEDGTCLQTSNGGHHLSAACFTLTVSADQTKAIALDCKISTERTYDTFSIFVDGALTHEFSGVYTGWQTVYAYIPVRSGTYTITFVYEKDNRTSSGEDMVAIRNVRFVSPSSITTPTEIKHSCATGAKTNGVYANYPDNIVLNNDDNYFHVGDEDGPLLMADLMNPTAWDTASSAWVRMMNGTLTFDIDGDGEQEDIYELFTSYCRYANNSRRYGLLAVTPELKDCLVALTTQYGTPHSKAWLELCYFYTVYGGADAVVDPIHGLAYYTAYDVKVTEAGQTPLLNHVKKETLAVPRGMWFKFVPAVTGVYNVRSVGSVDTYLWLADDELNIYEENDDDPYYSGPSEESGNFCLSSLFEAGKTYYILCDFNNVDELNEFDFVLTHVASAGSVWSHASAGDYAVTLDEDENVVDVHLRNAVEYILDPSDNCYHVKNEDGTPGALLYIDMCGATNLFPDNSVKSMLTVECYYCKSCGYKYPASIAYFESLDEPACPVCLNHDKTMFQKKLTFELPTVQRNPLTNEPLVFEVTYESEDDPPVVMPMYELNSQVALQPNNYLSDIVTYGIKFQSYTDRISYYVGLAENTALNPTAADEISLGVPAHDGYTPAKAELVEILKKLITFGDYALSPYHENVWLMLASYYRHIG